MPKATGSFQVSSWDEDAYEQLDGGGKLTRATVAQTFTGDLAGEGAVQWLMSYREDGTAHFVGLQRVTGTVDDRTGSLVLENVGDFDGKVAGGTWTVVPGSGSGDLAGITGEGSFTAPFGSEAAYELDYRLDGPR